MAELGSVLGGRYRLEQVLGQGGMATIFRATDSKLGREVAVKVLRPEFGSDAQFVNRFKHEARAAASLSHPNIVQVYDFGTDPAGPYIVMEQVAGGDLSVALGEHGALPPTAVARTGQQVADALAAAHARGLVHRDIKPSNILLSPDGRVQVADFGIARAAAASAVTATGITLGSVLYFSPEQARGDVAGPPSDIYSLGLVMYELLTGQRAFSGDSPAAVAVARLSGGVPSPMAVRADLPPALDAIVRWCLAPDPAARPPAAELSTALARFIADPSGAAAYATVAGAVTVPGSAAGGASGTAPTTTVVPVPGLTSAVPPARAGSGPWAWMAAALGLLVIVASGILLFLLFSGIGDRMPPPSPTPAGTLVIVRMPDFVGRTEDEAIRMAERRGLIVEADYVEADGESGQVIDQLPSPGTEIPAGTSVQVTITTRGETVVVPDVHGIKEATAIAQLESSGLTAGLRTTVDDLLPRGYVLSTDPRAGVSVTRGSPVSYAVSTGVASGSAAEASRTMAPASTNRPSEPPSPSPARTAAPASPGPVPSGLPTATGSMAATRTERPPTPAPPTPRPPSPAPVTPAPDSPSEPPGSTIAPAVEPGESPGGDPSTPPLPSGSPPVGASPSPFPSHEVILVGDFLCLDLATARAHIEEAGLLIGAMIPSDPAPGDSWIVHDQLPKAGESVPVGANVDLVLRDPMEPCPAG